MLHWGLYISVLQSQLHSPPLFTHTHTNSCTRHYITGQFSSLYLACVPLYNSPFFAPTVAILLKGGARWTSALNHQWKWLAVMYIVCVFKCTFYQSQHVLLCACITVCVYYCVRVCVYYCVRVLLCACITVVVKLKIKSYYVNDILLYILPWMCWYI